MKKNKLTYFNIFDLFYFNCKFDLVKFTAAVVF